MRQRLAYNVFLLLLIIATIHASALVFSLYWLYWWLDIVMHFIGGMFAAGFSLFLVWSYLERRSFPKRATYELALAGTFAAGLIWELFEYKTGLTFTAIGNYPLDTLKDMILDMSGGFLAIIFIKRYFISKNRPDAYLYEKYN